MPRHRPAQLAGFALAAIATALMPAAAPAQTPRLSDIVVARNVTGGQPVAPGDSFPPDIGEIFVWFRHDGLADETEIRSVWYFIESAGPSAVGEAAVTVRAPGTYGDVSLALAPGKLWPEGAYRVVLFVAAQQAGVAQFRVIARAGTTEASLPPAAPPMPSPAPPPAAAPPRTAEPFPFVTMSSTPATARPPAPLAPSAPSAATRYVHPRSGFGLTPPEGWTIDDAVGRVDVRITPAHGGGVIEVSSTASAPIEPMSAAAQWESSAVGPGKPFRVRLRGDAAVIDGERAYAAVYAGAAQYCKAVFVPAGDRLLIVTAVFATEHFSAGEVVFDAMMRGFRLPRR